MKPTRGGLLKGEGWTGLFARKFCFYFRSSNIYIKRSSIETSINGKTVKFNFKPVFVVEVIWFLVDVNSAWVVVDVNGFKVAVEESFSQESGSEYTQLHFVGLQLALLQSLVAHKQISASHPCCNLKIHNFFSYFGIIS